MNCTRCRELFVDALYNQVDPSILRDFDSHLSGCAECAGLYNEMKETLHIMNHKQRVEPDRKFLDSFWNSIAPRLENPNAGTSTRRRGNVLLWHPSRVPVWAYAVAALLLITVGIYIGKMTLMPPVHEETFTTRATPPAPLDSTDDRAMAYLERSKNLLIGLVNTSEADNQRLDYSHEQRVSRELIEQANVLKVALNRPDERQLRQLVLDLEVILLQLANVEVKPGVPAIEFVRQGVDQKSILLKINLEQMRASAHRSAPVDRKKNSNL